MMNWRLLLRAYQHDVPFLFLGTWWRIYNWSNMIDRQTISLETNGTRESMTIILWDVHDNEWLRDELRKKYHD